MAIQLDCTCGKKLRVGDELTGQRARCPECRKILSVPTVPKNEPYAFADERGEDRRARISSQPREDLQDGEDIPEIEAAEESDTGKKKPGSWVPAYCYKCDVSDTCKRCVFYSGQQASVESSSDGPYVVVRTRYRNIQSHQIFLCRACALEGWKKHFLGKILMAAGGMALILLIGVLFLVVPKTGSATAWSILLVLFLVVFCVPLYDSIVNLRKLLNPTFSRSVMGTIAIRLTRREVSRHTDADSFFTESKMKRMRRG